jgi:hypothetical protein
LACYGALLACAASELLVAAAVLAVGVATLALDQRLAPSVEDVSPAAGSPRLPLAISVLLVVPVASNLLVIPLVLASGSALSALPAEAVVGVTAVAAGGAGGAAVRHGAPAASHGWWALVGGGMAATLLGMLAVFSS